MKRRILSLVIAAIMVFGVLGMGASAKGVESGLKFNADGNFRIMHITDTHYTDFPFEESIAFIEKALDDYKPDLVIFGGDNIKGWFDTSLQLGTKAAIDKLVAPVAERSIPFSFVYGNHDWEAYLCPKQLQNKYYGAYEACILPDGYSTISKTSNGNILIKDYEGKNDIFNIWLFDSGTKVKVNGTKTIQGVDSKEVDWYVNRSNELKQANGGRVIPAIAFQHFGVEETVKLFVEDENGFECNGKKYILKDGITDGIKNGVAGVENIRMTTHLNKSCEIPSDNGGEYAAFVKQGDVVGLFTGHTHANDFCGITEDNIILGSTLSAGGFNISSRFTDADGNQVEARGLRIIDIDENSLKSGKNLEAISTFSVYYTDYFTGSIEKYPKKYKAYDEHDFGEWIKIEFEYFIDFIKSIFSFVK